MGEATAEALSSVEEVRQRLDAEVTVLQERLPAPAVMVKRMVGIAVGGGVAGMMFWMVVRRARNKRGRKRLTNASFVMIPSDMLKAAPLHAA